MTSATGKTSFVKVDSIIGATLNWLVASIVGQEPTIVHLPTGRMVIVSRHGFILNYSEDWALSGPIIEAKKIRVEPDYPDGWLAMTLYHGDTLLEAAMRYYISTELGHEVEVPVELLSN